MSGKSPSTPLALHLSSVLFLVSLSIFSVLLCIKLDHGFSPSYLYLLIPWLTALIALMAIVDISINAATRGSLDVAKNLTRVGSGMIIVLWMAGSSLAAAKMEGKVDTSWAIPFIPLWISMFLFGAILVLLFPGLVDPTINLHRMAFLSIVYLCTATLCSIFTALHLDLNVPDHWTTIFLPIWVAFGLHGLSLVCYFPKPPSKGEDGASPRILEFLTLIFAVAFCILLNIRLEVSAVPAAVAAAPLWALLALCSAKEALDYWHKDDYVGL